MNSNIAPMLKIENNFDKNMSKELIIVIDDQEQTFLFPHKWFQHTIELN